MTRLLRTVCDWAERRSLFSLCVRYLRGFRRPWRGWDSVAPLCGSGESRSSPSVGGPRGRSSPICSPRKSSTPPQTRFRIGFCRRRGGEDDRSCGLQVVLSVARTTPGVGAIKVGASWRGRGPRGYLSLGSLKRKTAPPSFTFSARSSPPWTRARSRAMVSPRPVPPLSRDRPSGAR